MLTNLDLHVIVQEQVAQFEVTVDDSVAVEVVDTLDSLPHEVSGLGLGHCLPALVKLQKRLEEQTKSNMMERSDHYKDQTA